MLLSIPVCNIAYRTVKMNTHIVSISTFSWHHVPNVNKANKILPAGIIIGPVLSGQLTKQLIQDLDCSIALDKGVCSSSELRDMAIEIE